MKKAGKVETLVKYKSGQPFEKHDCNRRTPGKIQVVPNTKRMSSNKHQRVMKFW